jgi:RNA polymerase sigma factor (TIGR02999 family)
MGDFTRILSDIGRAGACSADQLLPVVYQELRQLAALKLARERPGQTLDATALVHEAYLRLAGGIDAGEGSVGHPGWANRRHFFAAAAEAMRRILVDNARRKGRTKHGGGLRREHAELDALGVGESSEDILALHEALERFRGRPPGQGQARRAAVLRRPDLGRGRRVPGRLARHGQPRLAVRPGLAPRGHRRRRGRGKIAAHLRRSGRFRRMEGRRAWPTDAGVATGGHDDRRPRPPGPAARSPSVSKRPSRSLRPRLEAIENRITPTVVVAGGEIFIHSGGGNDSVNVAVTPTQYRVTENGVATFFNHSQVYKGSVVFYGNAGNDLFFNNTALNAQAYGGAGDDVLFGGTGNDRLEGGDGRDGLSGGAGHDLLVGGSPSPEAGDTAGNILEGGDGDDHLYGGSQRDELHGQAGSDTLVGNRGDDLLLGGLGLDYLRGNEGNDVLEAGLDPSYLPNHLDGGAGDDTLTGGYGDDTLLGGDGHDVLNGHIGNDQLFGGRGNDTLTGDHGTDTLHGEEGEDYLDGGYTNDYLYGGDGNDT